MKIKFFGLVAPLFYALLLPKGVLASDAVSFDTKIPEKTVIQQEETWELCRFSFYYENDMFSTTDGQYSSGEKFNWFYHVDNRSNLLYDLLFIDYGAYDAYANLSIVNQIYTPVDLTKTELIVDDRPYAGWSYLEYGIHKSSQENCEHFEAKPVVGGTGLEPVTSCV